jgi:hypothetical protein
VASRARPLPRAWSSPQPSLAEETPVRPSCSALPWWSVPPWWAAEFRSIRVPAWSLCSEARSTVGRRSSN